MYLLATLFLVIFVKPFITVEVPIVGVMGLLLYLNLIGCVVATARSRNQLILTGSLALAAAGCQTLWSQSQTGTTLTLFLGLTSVFYLAVAVQFVRAFFRDGEPFSGDGLAGAVAAYLLIGLVWGITVAIIDSGVDTTHPFLRTRIVAGGLDLVDRGTAPLDDGDGLDNDGDTLIDEFVGHGTMVAGIVALVAPEAKLLPIRVLDSDGSSTVFRLIDGIYAATDLGADILNISLGTPGESELLMEAVLEATAAGRLVICSTGNDATDGITVYPAGLGVNGVIGVAATRNNDTIAPFTNFGWVTMAAPGDPVVGPVPGGAYGRASGTSFSAPIVSGAAAIVRSVMPAVPMDHIRSLIVDTAQNVDEINPEYQGKLGSGRLSLPNAVKNIPNSSVADLNANRRVDVDDLYEMYQNPRDLNADGVIDQKDFDALEAFIRRGEHTLP